jgi:hypothetical protein
MSTGGAKLVVVNASSGPSGLYDELHESRGRESGKDEQDWLRAEHEIRAHQR